MPIHFSISDQTTGMARAAWEAEFLRQLALHYRNLYACALSVVGNKDDANDVIQEVCVVLWQKYPEFDEVTNFRKWACTIAFNLAKNHVRKQRRQCRTGLSDQAMVRIVQFRSAGSELLELRREVLRDCLAKMSQDDRNFLAECYQGSRNMIDVARGAGRTVSAVYSKLKRMRRILTDCVQLRLGKGEDW